MRRLKWQYNRIKSYIGRPRLLIQERTIVLDETEYCDSPLFITGCHRSGTSLVCRKFNSHPQIACPPESFFISSYARMFQDGAIVAGYDGFGFDREQCRVDLARKASSLHEAFRAGHGKALWADKTPEYVQFLHEIDALYAHRARFVLVYRHPWEIAYSMWKRGWKYNDIADGLESALVFTREAIVRMRAFEAAVPERCARIVYRQLCEDPASVLSSAMAHVGLAFDPDMLEFGSKNHNFGTEDPVFRGKPTIEMSQSAWQSWSPAQMRLAREIIDPDQYPDIC